MKSRLHWFSSLCLAVLLTACSLTSTPDPVGETPNLPAPGQPLPATSMALTGEKPVKNPTATTAYNAAPAAASTAAPTAAYNAAPAVASTVGPAAASTAASAAASTAAPVAEAPTAVAPVAAAPTAVPAAAPAAAPTAASTAASAAAPTAAAPTAAPTTAPILFNDPIAGTELNHFQQQTVDVARQAGAYWIRRNYLDWALVETEPGLRNWEAVKALEEDLPRVAASGGQAVLVVRGAPAWAQARPGVWCGPLKPESLALYAGFLHEAVLRYSAAPYHVMFWELHNEPDIDPALVPSDSPFGCMGDVNDAYYGGGKYAELLKVAYPQIKRANPQAQVLVGGLLADCNPVNPPNGKNCTPSLYLEGILRAGGGDYFDGVSFHAYDYYQGGLKYGNSNWHAQWNTTGPVVIPKSRYLAGVLAQYQHADKYLINSEAGLICGRDGSEADCQTNEFMLTKAYYAAQTNFSALAEGLRGNIWYSLTGWRGSALVGNDLQSTKAYEAFRVSAQQLLGARFSREISEFPGVRGYEIIRPQGKLWFLYSADGLEHVITLPALPAGMLDTFGAPLTAAVEITITAAPVYVQFP